MRAVFPEGRAFWHHFRRHVSCWVMGGRRLVRRWLEIWRPTAPVVCSMGRINETHYTQDF
jgi:hypothetical protein